jgi:hypothetical protein
MFVGERDALSLVLNALGFGFGYVSIGCQTRVRKEKNHKIQRDGCDSRTRYTITRIIEDESDYSDIHGGQARS